MFSFSPILPGMIGAKPLVTQKAACYHTNFHYLEYGADKMARCRTRSDGSVRAYVVSPYQMAARDGNYYLVRRLLFMGDGASAGLSCSALSLPELMRQKEFIKYVKYCYQSKQYRDWVNSSILEMITKLGQVNEFEDRFFPLVPFYLLW